MILGMGTRWSSGQKNNVLLPGPEVLVHKGSSINNVVNKSVFFYPHPHVVISACWLLFLRFMHVITKLYFGVPPWDDVVYGGPYIRQKSCKRTEKVSPWEVFVYTIFEGWATVLHVELHIVMKQMFNIQKLSLPNLND